MRTCHLFRMRWKLNDSPPPSRKLRSKLKIGRENDRFVPRKRQRMQTRVEGRRSMVLSHCTPTSRLHATEVNIAAWLIGRCARVSPRAAARCPIRARAGDETRARSPALVQRERGKRPLGARSHKVNYCGVHAAETRLPRSREARQGESLRRVSLPFGHARATRAPTEDDAPSMWSAVPRAVSDYTSHYLRTLTCWTHIILLTIVNRQESFHLRYSINASCKYLILNLLSRW